MVTVSGMNLLLLSSIYSVSEYNTAVLKNHLLYSLHISDKYCGPSQKYFIMYHGPPRDSFSASRVDSDLRKVDPF